MRAQLLDIPPVVTDREWADGWADRLEDLLLEAGKVFPRADLRRWAATPMTQGVPLWTRWHAGLSRPNGPQR